MTKEEQITYTQLRRKIQKKGKSSMLPEQTEELSNLEKLPNSVPGSANPSFQNNAGMLSDSSIPFRQRQKMAAQIGKCTASDISESILQT